ncbi:MAG: redoxin domain-containing protein [Bacteroidota bacterium]
MTKLLLSLTSGLLLGMSLWLGPLYAQQNRTIKSFSLMQADQTEWQASAYQDQRALVVVFTSSHCAWATKYEERLHQLHSQYATQQVAFVAINSNDPTMSERDEAKLMRQISPYPFPYLKDKDQQIAKLFKATKNPEVFVLRPTDNDFEIIYHGKIDDNPLDPAKAGNHFLEESLKAAIEGKKPEKKYSPASGCNIRWR